MDQATFEQVKDYVLQLLGAPAVKVDLNDEEIRMCYDRTRKLIETYKRPMDIRYLQTGTFAGAQYCLGKKKMRVSFSTPGWVIPLSCSFPEDDGWDLMCEGSGAWDDLKEEFRFIRRHEVAENSDKR